MQTLTDDPVLTRFKAAVADAYGDRLERVLLFGSRARGDEQTDSDYDVAVFIQDLVDRGSERSTLSDIGFTILEEQGRIVNAIPFAAGSLTERTPLMFEIRKDGVEI